MGSTVSRPRTFPRNSRSVRYGRRYTKKQTSIRNVLALLEAARRQSEQVLAAPLTTVGLPLSTIPEERSSNINKVLARQVLARLKEVRRQSDKVLAASRKTVGLPLFTISEERSSNLSTSPEEIKSKSTPVTLLIPVIA